MVFEARAVVKLLFNRFSKNGNNLLKIISHYNSLQLLKTISHRSFSLFQGSLFQESFWSNRSWTPFHKIISLWLRKCLLCLIRDYFKNRSQVTCINKATSDILPLHWAVPQCSSLGPLLFNIFINDLSLAVFKLEIILFAMTCHFF